MIAESEIPHKGAPSNITKSYDFFNNSINLRFFSLVKISLGLLGTIPLVITDKFLISVF